MSGETICKPFGRIGTRARRRVIAALRERNGDNCHYCEGLMVFEKFTSNRYGPENAEKATIEHRAPRCRGGTNLMTNLVLAHMRCNTAKGDMTEEAFKESLHDH